MKPSRQAVFHSPKATDSRHCKKTATLSALASESNASTSESLPPQESFLQVVDELGKGVARL